MVGHVMKFFLFFLFFTALNGYCHECIGTKVPLRFARHFELYKLKAGYRLVINSEDFYFLKKPTLKETTDLTCKQGQIFTFPLNRLAVTSSTHLGFLHRLDALNLIVGVSGERYIYNETIQKKIKEGLVHDMGFPWSTEIVLKLRPDLLLTYMTPQVEDPNFSTYKKLKAPYLLINEHLEQSPLARFEWILVFGVLIGQLDLAQKIFLKEQDQYLTLTHGLKDHHKNIIVGKMYAGQWYGPNPDSYLVQLIRDAKGHYVFDNIKTRFRIVKNFENILQLNSKIDIWLPESQWKSKDEILKEDKRYGLLKVFKENQIYNNSGRLSTLGANDYWESGVANPLKCLQDLITIFSSQESSLVYYRRL